jgi:ATP-binding cassette, subfamily C, bacterial LapB
MKKGGWGKIPEMDGFRRGALRLLVATVAVNVLSLALPIMTTQVYDRILPNQGTGTLAVLVAGVCVAMVLETILRLARAYAIGRAGAAFEHRMACASMNRVLGADLSRMERRGTGACMNRMAAAGKLKDFHNGQALTVVADLAFVPLYFALVAYIAHTLVLVPAAVLAAFVAVSVWRGARLRAALKARERADDRLFDFLIETLERIHTVKAFGLEKTFERRHEGLEETSTQANHRVTQETAGAFNAGAVFSHLMVAAVVSAGAWMALQGQLSAGALVATLLLSGRMMQPMQKALGLWTQWQDAVLARAHVREMMSLPQRPVPVRVAASLPVPDGRLAFENVGFTRINKEPVFANISLELGRGEAVLVTGGHGSGKTTLMDLAAGICPATNGMVRIDGEDINAFTPEELARRIGYVRARPLIFRGTLRDNITCFGQIPEGQAREIAQLLNVDRDVARLPGGFDTFLNGNETDSIPPGLKQRVAMVRVLAARPRLILFDNADRGLDKEGYAMTYSLLARLKGRATLLLATDDKNLRSLADRHYVLKDGTLTTAEETPRPGNVRPYRELRL